MRQISIMDQSDRYFVWYSASAGILVLAYVLIFMSTSGMGLGASFVTALANILPLVALGFGVRPLAKALSGRPLRYMIAGLISMACLWSLCWYLAVALTIGLAGAVLGAPFQLVWLQGPALLWQSYQGLVVFALICVGHYALEMAGQLRVQKQQLEKLEANPVLPPAAKPATTMIKTDEGLIALSLDDILILEANDDASFIITRKARLRSGQSLAEWSQQLDGGQFVRIHRSRIVNLARVISAEPIGEGRLMVHLEGGHSVEASRSGARRLKELAS